MKKKKPKEFSLTGKRNNQFGLLLSQDDRDAMVKELANDDLKRLESIRNVDDGLLKYIWSETINRHEGLKALCGAYGIPEDDDCYYWLSMSLASQFLASPKPVGAKAKWKPFDFARLVIEADDLFEKHAIEVGRGSKNDWVFCQLADREPYKTLLKFKNPEKKPKDSADTLHSHYKKHKNDPEVKALRNVIRQYFPEGLGGGSK